MTWLNWWKGELATPRRMAVLSLLTLAFSLLRYQSSSVKLMLRSRKGLPSTMFWAAPPNVAAVQFVIQSNGSTSAICIWNVDATAQSYPNHCVMPAAQQRSGGLQAFDYGNIHQSN